MAKPAVDQAPEDGTVYKKRSFLRLPVEVDCALLLADYRSVPAEAWSTSHWDMHCSADMLLLRGGDQGSATDFSTNEISNRKILSTLPYISSLIGEDGPFGQTTYAFIFRMKPMGVTRAHWDQQPIWKNLFRVHIPIMTNPDAVLMSEKRAKHFPVGEAWTFDNQKMHGVVNGDSVRTHLIFDVPHGPKLYALLQAAEWDPGVESPEQWQRTLVPSDARPLVSIDTEPLSYSERTTLELNPEGFASRVVGFGHMARLVRPPVRAGDIIYSVNGVEVCEVARTATDYIRVRHKHGETITLGILRDGKRIERAMSLKSENYLSFLRKPWRWLRSLKGWA